jgi:hypothetical protein
MLENRKGVGGIFDDSRGPILNGYGADIFEALFLLGSRPFRGFFGGSIRGFFTGLSFLFEALDCMPDNKKT